MGTSLRERTWMANSFSDERLLSHSLGKLKTLTVLETSFARLSMSREVAGALDKDVLHPKDVTCRLGPLANLMK